MSKTPIPTPAQVDALADRMPATAADAFGRSLNSSDRRLTALRASGYTGPIDQDGYPDTTSPAAEILRTMARRRGQSVDW